MEPKDGASPAEPQGADPPVRRSEISWIVLHPDRPAVLVTDRDGSAELLSSELPGEVWLGDAPVLLAALTELGLDGVLLGCRELVDDQAARRQRMTMVATPRPDSVTAPAGTRWAGPDEVGSVVPNDIRTVRSGRPPWEAPGWFPATERWLRAQVAALGRSVTGRVEQQRSWELSSVLRAPTNAGPVWLKAAAGSSLFTDEGAVLGLLADWFPAQVPAPLAWDRDRSVVLLDDLGPELGRDAPIEHQEEVLIRFARAQAVTSRRLAELRAVGLADRGPARLAEQAAAWLPDLEPTAQLPGIDPSWLTEDEQAALGAAVPRLVALCQDLISGPVPLTLLHGDLHMNNVSAGPTGRLLFDWTDACTGHPFFDLTTALHGTEETRTRLKDAYLACWTDYASPGRLADLWRTVEVLGPLHHAISYRAIAAGCAPPVDLDMASATAGWLRSVLTGLEAMK